MTLKSDIKFGEESNRRFKMDMTNLTNFDLSIRKSQTGPSIKDIRTLGGGGGGEVRQKWTNADRERGG